MVRCACVSVRTSPGFTGEHRWVVCCPDQDESPSVAEKADPDHASLNLASLRRGCMTGPQSDAWVQVGCACAFAGTALLWGVVGALLVWPANAGMVVLNAVVWVTTLVFFCLTTFTDPGVLPRGRPENATDEMRRDPLWCGKCHLVRPLGTYHCEQCDSCCVELDHHCGVVGHCIGARNKTWFAGMVGGMNLFGWSAMMFTVFGVVFRATPSLWTPATDADREAVGVFQACAWTAFAVMAFLYVVMTVSIVSLAMCPTMGLVRLVNGCVFGRDSTPLVMSSPRGGLFFTREPREACSTWGPRWCTVPRSRVLDQVRGVSPLPVSTLMWVQGTPLSSTSDSPSAVPLKAAGTMVEV